MATCFGLVFEAILRPCTLNTDVLDYNNAFKGKALT
jgi:hypothetical protein